MLPEHSVAKKLRALLTLAAGALAVGSQGEAVAASNGARSLAEDAGLARIYICYHRTCPFVRDRMPIETGSVPEFMRHTPALEWKRSEEYRESCGCPTYDPADYIIVGCVATGAVNERGCHAFFPDWTDAHEASIFATRALSEAT